jgi:hypothetical protein
MTVRRPTARQSEPRAKWRCAALSEYRCAYPNEISCRGSIRGRPPASLVARRTGYGEANEAASQTFLSRASPAPRNPSSPSPLTGESRGDGVACRLKISVSPRNSKSNSGILLSRGKKTSSRKVNGRMALCTCEHKRHKKDCRMVWKLATALLR